MAGDVFGRGHREANGGRELQGRFRLLLDRHALFARAHDRKHGTKDAVGRQNAKRHGAQRSTN